jgi:hypothetical protein
MTDNQMTVRTANPFQAGKQELTASANSESDRAIQEVQASLVIAKRFPRDQISAMDRILNACTRPSLAAQSLYSYAKGGTDITGPSIRLAEAIAQHWGNMTFGVKEIARFVKDGVGHSEVEAYAWDLETNTRKPVQFVVKHWRDTKQGGYALKDERDIYELVANQAARRLRSCILAIIPGDVTESAQNQCEATMAADADAGPEAQKRIVESFAKYGVTQAQIEKVIQRRMDSIQPAQVIRLRKIHTSLRDGMSTPGEWFEQTEGATIDPSVSRLAPLSEGLTAAVKAVGKKRRESADQSPNETPQPEPRPQPSDWVTGTFIGSKVTHAPEGTTPQWTAWAVRLMQSDEALLDCETFSKTIGAKIEALEADCRVRFQIKEKPGKRATLTELERIEP